MTRRPPAVAGYPDARPIRDGIRLAVWTLRCNTGCRAAA
jgi:hypothetical protein